MAATSSTMHIKGRMPVVLSCIQCSKYWSSPIKITHSIIIITFFICFQVGGGNWKVGGETSGVPFAAGEGAGGDVPLQLRGSEGSPPWNWKIYILSGAIWHIIGLIFSALTFAIFCFHQWYHVKLSAGKTLIKEVPDTRNGRTWERKSSINIQPRNEVAVALCWSTSSSVVSSLLLLPPLSRNSMCVPLTAGITAVLLVLLSVYFSSESNVKLFQFGCCHASSLCRNWWFG